ncbi:TetR family transcriptional regulator [Xanthobacter dioxanivorans]|uniref:TetR family transcriptional regulator n=1 Tax=Xanthobacter dioxanivorans TaxID=2528964 RepID=A0A974PPA3_9HYPH|nr:TetR family transcriptional regulator [Xanthobacter dioxanivorans]QRG07215.1 TetR family transcriptional regulator [Xanthobacter dioxanivorans]
MLIETAIRPAVATRDRILAAAILRFSRHAYEETGLRDIAEDVGVDVAYVHRCFGSKERLFTEALRATTRADRLLADVASDPAPVLAGLIFSEDGPRSPDEVTLLDIVIRSLSSPKAASVLRAFIVEDFIAPLSERLGRPGMREASMIAAFLVGIGIMRTVLQVTPLQEPEGGELERRMAEVIACAMGETARPT